MIFDIVMAVMYFILSIMFHELGHATMMWFFTKKFPKIRYNKEEKAFEVGKAKDYYTLSHTKYVLIIWAGIIMGIFPLLLINTWMFFVAMVLYFFMGCKSDIMGFAESMQGYKTNRM